MKKLIAVVLVSILAALALTPGAALAATGTAGGELAAASLGTAKSSLAAQASKKAYEGVYSYTLGDPDKWGTGESGYTLDLQFAKVTGNKVKLRFSQAYFYGYLGFYHIESKYKTTKVNNGYANFKVKTLCGDTVAAHVKLVNRNKVKLYLKTRKAGYERIPFGTGSTYKTLTRVSREFNGVSES